MGSTSRKLRLTKAKPLCFITTPAASAGPDTPAGSNDSGSAYGSHTAQLADLQEQNAVHHSGIVSTETKHGLLIRCGCLPPSAVGYGWVGAGRAAQHGARQRQAFPGPTQQPAVTRTRGSDSEKCSFLLFLCRH